MHGSNASPTTADKPENDSAKRKNNAKIANPFPETYARNYALRRSRGERRASQTVNRTSAGDARRPTRLSSRHTFRRPRPILTRRPAVFGVEKRTTIYRFAVVDDRGTGENQKKI